MRGRAGQVRQSRNGAKMPIPAAVCPAKPYGLGIPGVRPRRSWGFALCTLIHISTAAQVGFEVLMVWMVSRFVGFASPDANIPCQANSSDTERYSKTLKDPPACCAELHACNLSCALQGS